MKLLWSMVKKDIRQNPVVTTVLGVFLLLSMLLMSTGFRTMGIMVSSLIGLNEAAIPPEYLQMHKGEIDEAEAVAFAQSTEGIETYEVVRMLNISNSAIWHEGESFEAFNMDNGLVVQNKNLDFLLDEENQIAQVSPGEIGVPVYYAEEKGIQVGDSITLSVNGYEKIFTVAHIIKDAQMNVALSGSKRLLVAQEDLDEVSKYMGEWEYIFEYLLTEDGDVKALENAYMAAGMPANGVAITLGLLTMINSISYGVTAVLVMLISIILSVIAVLCLSYIIRATLTEESRNIGTMKAMGFPEKDIIKLYLIKYIALTGVAGIVGFLASIPVSEFFATSVVHYCGEGTMGWLQWILSVIGVLLLALLVIVKCKKMLCKSMQSQVVTLLKGEVQNEKERHYKLPQRGFKSVNVSIALGEFKCKWQEFIVIFWVFVLASFLILLPMNLKNTIDDPSFITYMGTGQCDIRIDIQYSEEIESQKETALAALETDADIETYVLYANGYVEVENAEGNMERLRVMNGDQDIFPIQFVEGTAPKAVDEMALSYLEATELGKVLGDTITVQYRGDAAEYRICGIYQDITYGGKTAKADISFETEDIEVYVIYLNLAEGTSVEQKVSELRQLLPQCKVTPVSEFISQTLGGVTDNIGTIEIAAVFLAVMLIVLITIMFLQLAMAREHSAIAIKKAMGLKNRDIKMQFVIQMLLVQATAIILGTILANSLGGPMLATFMSSMGCVEIAIRKDPMMAYLICPALQLIICTVTAWIATKNVCKYSIRDQIVE